MIKWAWISISLFLVILLSAPILAQGPRREGGGERRTPGRPDSIGRQSDTKSETTRRTPSRESNYSRPERKESGRDSNFYNRQSRDRDNEPRRDNEYSNKREKRKPFSWERIDRDYYRSEQNKRTYHYTPPPVVYSYPKAHFPDYPSERHYPSYRNRSCSTPLSWLALAVVIAITCDRQSTPNYVYCSSRESALIRCKSEKGSEYRNYFYTEPYNRPWWIPEQTYYDGSSTRLTFCSECKSYGSWYLDTWYPYDPFDDPVVTDKILSVERYRY